MFVERTAEYDFTISGENVNHMKVCDLAGVWGWLFCLQIA